MFTIVVGIVVADEKKYLTNNLSQYTINLPCFYKVMNKTNII